MPGVLLFLGVLVSPERQCFLSALDDGSWIEPSKNTRLVVVWRVHQVSDDVVGVSEVSFAGRTPSLLGRSSIQASLFSASRAEDVSMRSQKWPRQCSQSTCAQVVTTASSLSTMRQMLPLT